MPIYEYQCARCAARKEFLLHVGAEPEDTVCSWCGGTLVRVPTVPAIRFKGDGWTRPERSTGGHDDLREGVSEPSELMKG